MRFRMTDFQRDIWNRIFPNWKHLCQPMEHVCSCVDLRESNVISAALSVKKPEISHVFRRCAAHLKLCKTFAKFYC